jgi:amino acid permease
MMMWVGVDEAFGFMAGWNFFLYEAFLIPFEISALNLVLTYWRDDIPVAAVVAACIVLYLFVPHLTLSGPSMHRALVTNLVRTTIAPSTFSL